MYMNSSHQQGIRITCLAQHPIYVHKLNQNACGSETYILSVSQNHKHSGSACVHKSGVVPDKLCVFPADES